MVTPSFALSFPPKSRDVSQRKPDTSNSRHSHIGVHVAYIQTAYVHILDHSVDFQFRILGENSARKQLHCVGTVIASNTATKQERRERRDVRKIKPKSPKQDFSPSVPVRIGSMACPVLACPARCHAGPRRAGLAAARRSCPHSNPQWCSQYRYVSLGPCL
jgi:hypothetical protein